MKKSSLYFALICFAFSCQDDANNIHDEVLDHALTGSWLYVESGYSPGSGYHIEPVPPVPPQIIRFNPDFRMSTNIDGLTKYKYYRIFDDSALSTKVIAFYEQDPGSEPQDVSNLAHSYSVVWEGNTLKLYYRWCIEGCHLGFKKISNS